MYYIEQINLLTIIGENILKSLELGMKIIKKKQTNKKQDLHEDFKTWRHIKEDVELGKMPCFRMEMFSHGNMSVLPQIDYTFMLLQ